MRLIWQGYQGWPFNMQPRKFVKEDLDTINGWLLARGLNPLKLQDLPAIGYINQSACGFIIQTELRHVGVLEFFATDPGQPREVRMEAVESILKALEEAGRAIGIQVLWFDTRWENLIEIASRNGYVSEVVHRLGKRL